MFVERKDERGERLVEARAGRVWVVEYHADIEHWVNAFAAQQAARVEALRFCRERFEGQDTRLARLPTVIASEADEQLAYALMRDDDAAFDIWECSVQTE